MKDSIRFVNLESDSPYFNLATEEYFLHHTEDNVFMLWQNHNTIVVGKYQNTLAEINVDFVKEKSINVVRRLTGGGAVFHDSGNINFTFIKNVNSDEKEINFIKFLQPIVDALRSLNVPASFSGRNDLVIEDKKISGNAMTFYKNRVLEHGTLLFSSKQADIAAALKADPEKFSDKSVKSVRSRVTNISDYLSPTMSVADFKNYLMKYISEHTENTVLKPLSGEEIAFIDKLSKEKYQTWEWNYGSSPAYSLNRKIRTKGGIIQAVTDVKNGKIRDIKFYGDYFSSKNPEDLAKMLIDTEHTASAVNEVLSGVEIGEYFNNATLEEIVSIITAN